MSTFKQLFQQPAAAGILLMGAAAAAMIAANAPPLAPLYERLLSLPLGIQAADATLVKPLLLWINDGLMAIFFLHVALEIKRECLEGTLSSPTRAVLPGIAALGGMLAPIAIYTAIAWDDPIALAGWAIPAATDIAFSLGVLALLGSRVPSSLKTFLLALAVIDDIGAVVIIAIFYTGNLALPALLLAVAAVAGLALLNVLGVRQIAPYVLLGAFAWLCVLQSGVHATLAGVAVGLTVPHRGGRVGEKSPLQRMEHELQPWVAFGILPIFAFANAGISIDAIDSAVLTSPVTWGIALGLFIGKQAGVFTLSWLAIQMGCAQLPERVGWRHLYGVSLLTGIGFTMSLFIASLAFDHVQGNSVVVAHRVGIMLGSLISAVTGYTVLRLTTPVTAVQWQRTTQPMIPSHTSQ
ncbi:Na+/H+ antiporter NhaA [Nitrococcus mobilis]|uniref:Na(+)/H(+) antiporter NhaA n=1 Tax=Nitrococcus mobilis Nb-231 TaxID=314278 RepID=A4BND0_9GAMM|nr:Na+/H+ antiporter NhaA [Nitrococcus mobilis]EAR22729.1 Na+/H+ antiporter NhaA [Nitrococcus mobilis Nb-231]